VKQASLALAEACRADFAPALALLREEKVCLEGKCFSFCQYIAVSELLGKNIIAPAYDLEITIRFVVVLFQQFNVR
jgi:hypothetical protein